MHSVAVCFPHSERKYTVAGIADEEDRHGKRVKRVSGTKPARRKAGDQGGALTQSQRS